MCGILFVYNRATKFSNADKKQLSQCLSTMIPRGPDMSSEVYINEHAYMGFRRLSIMDTSVRGLQPFQYEGGYVVCNGEIYNYTSFSDLETHSGSDCELILPLYNTFAVGNDPKTLIQQLDAEFAWVIYDGDVGMVYAARDRYGVRPLFYGTNIEKGWFGFASDVRALHPIMTYIMPVRPQNLISIDLSNYVMESEQLFSIRRPDHYMTDVHTIHHGLCHLLTHAVKKRLHADRPIGFLLSGGLDSSSIVAIVSRLIPVDKIVCFSIGLKGSVDIAAAKKVVDYLSIKHHHCVEFTIQEGLDAIDEVIEALASYDVTTIRASIAQYLLAKYISQKTDIRVIQSGEGSDEMFGGYRYERDAPSPEALFDDTVRLLDELYMYDCLRTDRTLAAWGLEARCPFLDHELVDFVMRIDPALKMSSRTVIEKKLLRDALASGNYLPGEILYRPKEAFSDAVSALGTDELSWKDELARFIDTQISEDEDLGSAKTKEAYYYRKIFNKYYPGRDGLITDYWMPRFQGEDVIDPSATVLKSYK